MKNKIKFSSIILAMLVSLLAVFGFSGNRKIYAQGNNGDDEIMPMGYLITISLEIGFENERVYAEAKNKFTLFPATVETYIILYSSETYQSSYQNMRMESENHISDLNIGNTIKTYAAINGVKRYWQARVRYKVDSGDWQEKSTDIWLVDADGTATRV